MICEIFQALNTSHGTFRRFIKNVLDSRIEKRNINIWNIEMICVRKLYNITILY